MLRRPGIATAMVSGLGLAWLALAKSADTEPASSTAPGR
jgi:hypothetical protein